LLPFVGGSTHAVTTPLWTPAGGPAAEASETTAISDTTAVLAAIQVLLGAFPT
jgi:hypothetical protein